MYEDVDFQLKIIIYIQNYLHGQDNKVFYDIKMFIPMFKPIKNYAKTLFII